MYWLTIFAHAGEEHETKREGFLHILTGSWYSAPMVMLLMMLILLSVYMFSNRSLTATVVAAQFMLLVGGVLLFQLMPILSMVCIVIGFALSLFVVMNGLRGGSAHEDKTR